MSMAASRDGLFGHFPPWGNQGAKGKGSSRLSPTFLLLRKTGNYSLLSLAEGTQDTALLLQGHFAAGFFLRHTGELPQARTHLEKALAFYDVEQHRPLAVRFGYDLGVASLSYLALVLWYLGYPTLASQKNEQSLRLARKISHAHSLAYALTAATWCHLLSQEMQATQAQAEELITFTTGHGFPYWLAQGNILWGWVAA
jgi:adenylate cyclase